MIYCECENDEVLLKALGKSRKEFKHKFGKFEVCKFLKKDNNSIGLIDEDPGKLQDKYPESLKIIYDGINKGDFIIVKEDIKNGNKIILLSPELEPWIEKAIAESHIKRLNYHLPDDLHDIGTDNTKLNRLQKMIEDILPESQILKKLLSFL